MLIVTEQVRKERSDLSDCMTNQTQMKKGNRLQRNFVQTVITSRLKCPICYDIFFKPRRLFCGHTFCKPCLQQLCSKEHNKNPQHIICCPLCRTPVDIPLIDYDQIAIRIIDDLEVTCVLTQCHWKGRSADLNKHYQECSVRAMLEGIADGAEKIIPEPIPIKKKKKKDQKGPIVVSVLSEDDSIDQEQLQLPQRISAEEYFYQKQPPQIPPPKLLVSRGMQTIHAPIENISTELPKKRRRRRRRRNSASKTQNQYKKPRIRRRRMKEQDKTMNDMKQEPIGPLTEEEELLDIKQMYQSMGFNFHEEYKQANKQIKPLIVNVDIQHTIVPDKRW